MRLDYADDEERPGQFALWNANCQRSIKGRAGQRALRELEAALLALPEKRLIYGALTDDSGGVCAMGCYARHKGVDLSTLDAEYDSDVGIAAGMPPLVAWQVVALNDRPFWGDDITRERYEKVLAWVRGKLTPHGATEGR